MSNVSEWSTSAASNNSASPNGAPEGMAPSGVNDTIRENMAALAKWYKDTNGSLTLAGTGSAYTLTTNNGHAALSDQPLIVAKVNTDNTGACTLNVDGLGAKDIKMPDGSDPVAGVLKTGSIVALSYESGADDYVLIAGNVAKDVSEDFALSGVISPSQITADQNNYSPTGLSTASTLRLTTDASRTITGIAGGASGRILILHNAGSNPLVLADESASSTAANRFAMTGDVTLAADDVAVLQYDSTTSRWRAAARPPVAASTTVSGVVEKATQAEIEAGTADKFVEAENLAAAVGFSKTFASSEQSISTDTQVDVAHSLGSVPVMVQVVLRCKTGEHGFSAGDEVFASSNVGDFPTDGGFTYFADATNVSIVQGNAAPRVISRSTFNEASITPGNWRWVVRAWA